MNKVKYVLIFMVVCVALTALADGDKTLTFVKTDGETVTFSTSGLVITYDGFAHALVSNDETKAIIDLMDVDYMCFGNVGESSITGDVNGDGEVNIADINAVVGIIIEGDTDEDTYTRADVNGDGEVNIADVNALIDIILAS